MLLNNPNMILSENRNRHIIASWSIWGANSRKRDRLSAREAAICIVPPRRPTLGRMSLSWWLKSSPASAGQIFFHMRHTRQSWLCRITACFEQSDIVLLTCFNCKWYLKMHRWFHRVSALSYHHNATGILLKR